MTIFDQALFEYNTHHELYSINDSRINQLNKLTKILNQYFKFETIYSVETGGSHTWDDGMVGYYFAYLANLTQGKFSSVDINPDIEDKVPQAYQKLNPNLKINHVTEDSVTFLKNLSFIPNLVHLDSWDVWLPDPLPSALHGWREFEAIKRIMPVGSIIIIDDNWYKGQQIEWVTTWGNGGRNTELIDIKYPIIGKGAHIYQWSLLENTNWKILDAGYKLIIQKQW